MFSKAILEKMAVICFIGVGSALAFNAADVGGLWNFRQGDLSATVGEDITYGALWTAQNTQFTVTDAGATVPDINGTPAKVMHVPQRQGVGSVYLVPHGAAVPNGGAGTWTTEYTLVVDILFAAGWSGGLYGSGVHNSYIDILIGDPESIEYQVFRGSSGWDNMTLVPGSDPNLAANTWYRIAVAVDAGSFLKIYKDGQHVAAYTDLDVPDSSWWSTGSTLKFARELSEAYVSSIATFTRTLSDAEIAGLGGPDADGIIIPADCGDPGTVYLELDVTGPVGVPDCVVDFYDFVEFTSQWLHCSDPADANCDQFWKTAS